LAAPSGEGTSRADRDTTADAGSPADGVLYRVVLEKRADIRRVMRAHGLVSPGE
jgi:hypothetical protein